MAGQVHPIGVRPLMFKRSVNYVKIVVHKEPALDGNTYTVLFLGTGEFLLLRKARKPIRNTPQIRIILQHRELFIASTWRQLSRRLAANNAANILFSDLSSNLFRNNP